MKPISFELRDVIEPSSGKRVGAWAQTAGEPQTTALQLVAGRFAVVRELDGN